MKQVTKSKVCLNFSVVRRYKVARVQDAAVQVYDYYEPSRWSQETPLPSSLIRPSVRPSHFLLPSACSQEGDSHVQLGLPAPGRLLLLLRPRLQPLPAGRRPRGDLLAGRSLLWEQRRHLLLGSPASRGRRSFDGVVIRKPWRRRRCKFSRRR